MLRIIQRFWAINWAEQWQYRANQLMYPLYSLVSPLVYLIIWMSVANSQGSVKGLTANDFLTYYLTLLLVNQFTGESTIYVLEYKIRLGSLSNELLMPVHPVLTNTLVNVLAYKALSFIVMIPVWFFLVFAFHPDYSAVSNVSVLLAVPALILGFGINFLLAASLTCLAFWTTRVFSIAEFYFALVTLLSGQFVPLTLMPGVVQSLAQYLPFQYFSYFPIELILNRLSRPVILEKFALEMVWLVIAMVTFQLIWRNGIKRYSAVGA
jgi:ABC-2 type transport system permease protein